MSVALVPYFVHDIVLAHVSDHLYAEIVIRPHFGHRGDSSPPKCGASSLSDQTDPIGDLTSLSRNGTHFPSIMTARFLIAHAFGRGGGTRWQRLGLPMQQSLIWPNADLTKS
jgi:hypothetical protein